MLDLLKDLFNRRWRTRRFRMSISAIRPIGTKSQLVHVTLLDVFIRVFIHAILFSTLSIEPEESANRHPRLVVLVQKPTRVALHAQAAQPVPAYRLTEAPPPGDVDGRGFGSGGGWGWRTTVGHGGSGSGGVVLDERAGGSGGGGGSGVEATLEIEAEDSLGILHWN